MKNPKSPRRDHRDWTKPFAKKAYDRKVDTYEHQQQAIIFSQAWLIIETVEAIQHIEWTCNSRDTLVMRIAQLAGVRLYHDHIDSNASHYARLKQGERQQIMRQAFDIALETGRILYVVDGFCHSVDAIVEKQISRPIFVDGEYVPDQRSSAKLRRWGEPAL